MSGAWLENCDRRTRELVRVARRQGWEVTVTSTSHVRFRSPDGAVVVGTGSGRSLDQHYRRTVNRLIRHGLDLPRR